MTSANVIYYKVFKNGDLIGEHRQNMLCRDSSERLLMYYPQDEFQIRADWVDEEEVAHKEKPMPLDQWFLNRSRFRPAVRTSRHPTRTKL